MSLLCKSYLIPDRPVIPFDWPLFLAFAPHDPAISAERMKIPFYISPCSITSREPNRDWRPWFMRQGIGAEASCHQLDFLTALMMTYTMPNTINTEMIAGPNGISQPPKKRIYFPSLFLHYVTNFQINSKGGVRRNFYTD